MLLQFRIVTESILNTMYKSDIKAFIYIFLNVIYLRSLAMVVDHAIKDYVKVIVQHKIMF